MKAHRKKGYLRKHYDFFLKEEIVIKPGLAKAVIKDNDNNLQILSPHLVLRVNQEPQKSTKVPLKNILLKLQLNWDLVSFIWTILTEEKVVP